MTEVQGPYYVIALVIKWSKVVLKALGLRIIREVFEGDTKG